MKTTQNPLISKSSIAQELQLLRLRLAESEKTIEAIQQGEVDTVLIKGKKGARVFTLEGEEHAYRLLIESMNEGAMILTPKGLILYANRYFANLIGRSLDQTFATSFLALLPLKDQKSFRLLLAGDKNNRVPLQIFLKREGDQLIPVQISICTLPRTPSQPTRIGVIIAEMTEMYQSKEKLRALNQNTTITHEKENNGISYELHGRITQLLCAIQFRSQALSNKIAPKNRAYEAEAKKLRLMIGKAILEIQEISQNLNSTVLDHLGLVAIIQDYKRHFEKRTGIQLELIFTKMIKRLPQDLELTLYRIFQEALKNVEQHSSAQKVTLRLHRKGNCVHLSIRDNGVGVDEKSTAHKNQKNKGLGVLRMHERVIASGGSFDIQLVHRQGTKIEVRIPLPSSSGSKSKSNIKKI